MPKTQAQSRRDKQKAALAGAAHMTPEQRTARAAKASAARWKGKTAQQRRLEAARGRETAVEQLKKAEMSE